ncbi:MAG: ATP-binding protein [Pseudomonadota bacterium]
MTGRIIQSLLDGVPLPACVIGRDERIVAANAPAEPIIGAGMVGRHHGLGLRQPALLEAIAATLADSTPRHVRLVLPQASQEENFAVTLAPVLPEGTPGDGSFGGGVLLTFQDVTEQARAVQMRRDFVANVSHELRTPLTALMGFIETLKGAARDDPAARSRFLGIMEREAGRMNRLVRDLLHLSRVEAEERVRPRDRVDLQALIQMAITPLRDVAVATQVEIAVIGTLGGVMVPGDADQLTQVFTNLVENAVKYGGAGKRVEVRLSREATLRGPALRVDVVDQGEGIDAIHLPRLTERFYRVDTHRSREQGGTGLGLAIVKHIVSRHRGWLKIDSTLGRGSVFSVILPEG